MEEHIPKADQLDAQGKASLRKKVLMQEKKKNSEIPSNKISEVIEKKTKREKRRDFYKGKSGYSTLLDGIKDDNRNDQRRSEAIAAFDQEELKSYYCNMVDGVDPRFHSLLRKLRYCPPVFNLEELSKRLGFDTDRACRSDLKKLNTALIEILKSNDIRIPSILSIDIIFFEQKSDKKVTLYAPHPFLLDAIEKRI